MSRLIIMSGPAGAGKTTWALNYQLNNYSIVLSTDDFREGNGLDSPVKEKNITKIITARAIQLSEDKDIDVIIDSAVVKNKSIMKWWNRLHSYFEKTMLVILDTPLEKCLYQNKIRKRHVPEDVIREMCSFREPLSDEIKNSFNEIIRVGGNN